MRAIKPLVVATVLAWPMVVVANQFICYGGSPGPLNIEASSMAEAQYKAEQMREPRHKLAIRCSPAASADVFVGDIRFKNNSQLRPYLPFDLKATGKRITCDASGGFLPDGESNAGSCEEFSSASTGTAWKVRSPFCQGTRGGCSPGPSGMMTEVWKKTGQAWKEWVEWEWATGYPLRMESPEARSYATAHGASPAAQRDSGVPANVGSPASNRPEDLVKKGVTDLLKGLGR